MRKELIKLPKEIESTLFSYETKDPNHFEKEQKDPCVCCRVSTTETNYFVNTAYGGSSFTSELDADDFIDCWVEPVCKECALIFPEGHVYELSEQGKKKDFNFGKMIPMEAGDFYELNFGEKVWRYQSGQIRGLRFVGLMPSSNRYCIFSDGEYLTHLYINESDQTFSGKWFKGAYDSRQIGEMKIKYLQDKIQSVKEIYLKE